MRIIIGILIFVFVTPVNAGNKIIQMVYEEDQEVRSKENLSRKVPIIHPLEERARRIVVFDELSKGNLKTADDFYKSSIILIHSGAQGLENQILAAKLAQRAIELGHPKGDFALRAAISRYRGIAAIPSKSPLTH